MMRSHKNSGMKYWYHTKKADSISSITYKSGIFYPLPYPTTFRRHYLLTCFNTIEADWNLNVYQ